MWDDVGLPISVGSLFATLILVWQSIGATDSRIELFAGRMTNPEQASMQFDWVATRKSIQRLRRIFKKC